MKQVFLDILLFMFKNVRFYKNQYLQESFSYVIFLLLTVLSLNLVAAEGITPEILANKIAASVDREAIPLGSKGFKVAIPQGNRNIVIRVMNQGGGRSNYYRVSIEGKEAFTKTGEVSTDRALTHIDIEPSSHEDIMNIIQRIRKENDPKFNP